MATDGLFFLFDMGIFDFFNNKKNARQEQLRLQEEKRRAEEQRRLAERRKQEEQQRREESFLSNFEFDSTCHQRYENGQPVRGLQVCPRYIKIKKNINGCSGYQLTPGDGYILTATNGDTGQPQFAPKPMRVVKISDSEILLKGYCVSAQTPFGWQEIDLSDYGFSIILNEGSVQKCVLHLYDRNVDLEYQRTNQSTALFSKGELESIIAILSDISYIFLKSDRLVGGRNEKMKSRLFSYAGIFGYYYEEEYAYGKVSDITDNNIASHYVLVKLSMSDGSQRQNVIRDLADNWSDVLQVIFNLELDDNEAGNRFKKMESNIQTVTKAIEKLSGNNCKKPSNPLKVRSKEVSYNPFNITEDLKLAEGRAIPDITDVFARELIPMLVSNQYSSDESREIVANYALSMIKSYYDNAGFVPMLIVDQITGQVNQVAEMVQKVSYTPYSSLKEYILSKIYK